MSIFPTHDAADIPATDAGDRVEAVIIGAMDEEVAPYLKRAAADAGTTSGALPYEEVGRARLWRTRIDGREVLVVRSGIGLVNAASAAVIALHRVQPDAILSTGSAGGLGGKVHVGDVAVGSFCAYSAADARAFGYKLGQVPGMPSNYPGEATLLEGAQAGDMREDYPNVVPGHVTSSDVFVDGERLDALRADFPDATATDMESTAIAQVAYSFGVPFLTARGISDLCGPDAGTEHPQTVEQVSEAAARVVMAAIAAR